MILGFVSIVAAASLNLELETRAIVVGQAVPLVLHVIDAGNPEGPPRIPTTEGLVLRYQSSSQSHVVVNFQSTRTISYTYQLSAVAPGSGMVGPVDMVVEGKRFHLDGIGVEVGEPPTDVSGAPVVASISDDTPYLGQVVVYRFQFRHEEAIVNARWSRPEFDGFVPESIAEPSQREYQMVEAGRPFTVQTIDVPLVAAGAGPRVIPPASLTAQYRDRSRKRNRRRRSIDDLFGESIFGWQGNVRSETHLTDSVRVELSPLPTEGQSPGFGGLVGRFRIEIKPSASTVQLGDSLTLEIKVIGDGTLSGFRLPSAPADAGFRAYDDAPEIAARVQDGRFMRRALVRRAIVPEAEGALTLPPIEIPVFDPEQGEYRTVRSDPIQITVLPGEEGAGEVASYADDSVDKRQQVESLGDDILPLSAHAWVGDATLRGARVWMMGLVGVPAGLWIVLGLFGWLRSRPDDPFAAVRRSLATLPKEPEARLGALEGAFRDVAGLRLGMHPPTVDQAAVQRLGSEALALYQDLDRARYGGDDAVDLEARVRRFVGRRR